MVEGSYRTARIVSFSLIATLVLVAIPHLSSDRAEAFTPGPLVIFGYVTDQAGRPMEGVDMVVVSQNGTSWAIMKTLTTKTDVDGFYQVTFVNINPPGMWDDKGGHIISTAQAGSNQESENVTIVEPDFGIQIDLQFPYEIPQFGTVLGFIAAAAIVGAVAIFLLLPKRSRVKTQ